MEFSYFKYIFEKMKPRSREESNIIKILVKNLGEFSNVKEVAEFLHLSKSFIYKQMEENNIIYLEINKRKIIYVRSLIVILRWFIAGIKKHGFHRVFLISIKI